MVNQFVTYEIALKLKELGFNEKCLYSIEYSEGGQTLQLNPNFKNNSQCYIGEITIPLRKQVIDWLREKHNLHIKFMINDSYDVNDKTWEFEIFDIDWGGDRVVYTLYRGKGFKTFNEMRESAICKSIELIKWKNLL